ncbi:MAG: carboxypeptidase regulatory-like domain-containing protein [Acidobacteriaceae bacterium]
MIIGKFPGNSRVVRAFCAGRSRTLAMLLMFAVLLGVSPVVAQTITGAIRGTVTDPSGAVVAGASVTATEVATGVATSTVTDHNGSYNFQFLPIGTYAISATKSGFSTSSVPAFGLQIDQIAKIDVSLQVGNTSTTVNVASSSSPIMQTQNSTMGTTISANTMESLPLSGLNFQTAGMFVPGAVNPTYSNMGGTSGYERDTSGATIPSFNGNRQQGNNYILDGIEINETLNNLVGYNMAPDAIQQMRVVTANADAEYGDVNGGEMLLVTKGGTNHIHGSVYEYFEYQGLTANLWSNNYSGVPKGVFHQNQFGATGGGPIIKNKLFIFGDYEGARNNASGLGAASVATAAMRTGDFSDLLAVNGIQLYNPEPTVTNPTGGYALATPYVNNQIPVNNPVAAFVFANPALYPLPNRTPIAGTVDLDNYQSGTASKHNNNQGDVRVDYAVGPKDSLMFRYSDGDAYDITSKVVLPVTFPTNNDYPFHSGVVNWVHTFSPSLINQFRAGMSRIEWYTGVPTDPSGAFGKTGDAKVGIPFPNQPFDGFSEMNFATNESNIGTVAIVTNFVDNDFNYGDDLIWEHGQHITKFGVQIARYQQNYYYAGNDGALGQFIYDNYYTANTTVGNGPGYGFADFVLDQADGAAIGSVAGPVGQRQYRDAYYVQDDWKIRPNLTLNLGLRYGYDQPIYEVNNKQLNVNVNDPSSCTGADDASNPCLEFAGENGNSRALYDAYHDEWMPRLGFAWQIYPKIVLRGGYGITDYMEGTGSNLRLTQNAPFLNQFSNSPLIPTTNTPGVPLSVTTGFTGTGAVAQTTYRAWAKNLRPTAVHQFNLTTQYLINNETTAQVGYVGEIGQRLVVPVAANQWATSGVPTSAPFYNLVGSNGSIVLTETEGVENYNAMQAVLHRQQANGLEFTLNYTWSKSMTNNPGFYGVPGVDNNSVYWQNKNNPHADYGPSGYDTRQAVNGTMVYELPFGRGRRFGNSWNRPTDEALGGWRLSGDVILYSGFPITIGSPNYANIHSGSARANQYRKMKIVHRSTQHWFGTDPSANPCTTGTDNGTCAYGVETPGQFGTARVNTERGPGYRIIDLSLFKSFQTLKQQHLELRADAFNAFNLASYSAPAYTLASHGVPAADYPNGSIWGLITSTLSPARQFQLSLDYRF